MHTPTRGAPPRRSTPDHGTSHEEGGFALLFAVFSIILLAGVIAASSESSLARDRYAEAGIAAPARARETAFAGVADALSWFRRQTVQPVQTFAPRLDLLAIPSINETGDPSVGLVREYEITPGVWARYEVRLGEPAESFTDSDGDGIFDAGSESYDDANGNGRRDVATGARDVSAARGQIGAGSVWLIESHGYLYKRPRADLPLDQSPNLRFATASVATEMRRMTITPPAAAAIASNQGGKVIIGSRARIRGNGGAGIGYRSSSGTPQLQSGSEVEGSPSATSVPGFAYGLTKVFGNTLSALKSMADVTVTDHSVLPANVGEYTLTVIDGDAVFNAARPLRGTGVVIVTGSCTIEAGSTSFFNGVLWVGDDLEIEGPCYIRGVCIVGDRAEVQGSGGDHAEIEYDAGIIDELMVRMGSYRLSKATYRLHGEAVPGSAP